MKSYQHKLIMLALLIGFHPFALMADGYTYHMSIDVGGLLAQENYVATYQYDGAYNGYMTSNATTTSCSQCSDPNSGLQQRYIPFSSAFNMNLDSGVVGAVELGITLPDFFTLGIELIYIDKSEVAQDNPVNTIDSDTLYLMATAKYLMFAGVSDWFSPYAGMGIGIARYSASGDFVAYSLNSVRNIKGISNTLEAQGSFDDLVSYNLAVQTNVGLYISLIEGVYLDLGLRNLTTTYIENTPIGSSQVLKSDKIIEDPGAAQNPTQGGCNGNTNAGCSTASLSPNRSVPIAFDKGGLKTGSITNSDTILDIGIKITF